MADELEAPETTFVVDEVNMVIKEVRAHSLLTRPLVAPVGCAPAAWQGGQTPRCACAARAVLLLQPLQCTTTARRGLGLAAY